MAMARMTLFMTQKSDKDMIYDCPNGLDARHPLDPSDFRRCVLLARLVPETRTIGVNALANLNVWSWRSVYEHWDEMESLLVEECGADLNTPFEAPNLYDLMKKQLI